MEVGGGMDGIKNGSIIVVLFFSCLFICKLPIAAAHHKEVLLLDDGMTTIDLYEHSLLLSDNEEQYDIDDLVSKQVDHLFIQPETFEKKPGFFPITKWLKVEIDNQASENDWLLEFAFPLIYEIHVYVEDDDGVHQEINSGAMQAFSNRDIHHRHFLYNLNIAYGEKKNLYILLKGGADLHPPINIWEKDAFLERVSTEYLFQGLFYGMILVMIVYNLFIFISLRFRAYLFYVISISLSLLAYMALNGDAYKLLWPKAPVWNLISVSTLVSLSCVFILLFTRDFLETNRYLPKFKYVTWLLMICNGLILVFLLFDLYLALNMMFLTTFLTFSSIITVGFMSLMKGVRAARFFVIGWLVFLGGTFITILERAVIIPYSIVTEYAGQGAMVVEVVLLSLALADKISIIRKEKLVAEQKLRESQAMAIENFQRADKLKDDFLAITSHELRTPLYGMIGIAESLRDGVAGNVSSDVRKQLDMIVLSGNRLSHLVNDILDFSKLRHESMVIQLKSVQLADVIKVVFTVCKPLLKDKNIRLVKRVEGDLPPVIADPDRLQQIMYNLIGNAIKYTDEGEVVVTANVIHGDEIAVMVSDTGKGISKEAQKVIFEPFQQGATDHDSSVSGAGIGLGVAKYLVNLHGGDLTVESEVGVGSIFMFHLPIDIEASYPTVEITTPIDVKEDKEIILTELPATPNKKKKKVLVVDDELVNLQVLMNHLILEDIKVMTATNGEEAFELVQDNHFDLIILDIMMPKLSGYEVCETLRESYSLLELPILMLTAKDRLQDKVLAFSVGANDYVTTPCDKEELLARVKTLIRLKKMNDEVQELNLQLEQKVIERTEELQLVNEDLQATNESLLKMAASRRNLLANIAHELGTPVMLLYSYMQALEADILSESDDKKYRHVAEQNIQVLNRLIDDLADLSHLEEGSTSLSFKQYNLADWLENVYEKLAIDVRSYDREFKSRPPTFQALQYTCQLDVERMNQVFGNILSNAVKHTLVEEGVITLSSHLHDDGKMIVLQIGDNGSGMEQSELPYLFHRFYQPKVVDNRKEKRGVGIGLAIVKEIIQGHHGKVWATSVIGKGSVFYIALPVYQQTDLEK